jgi:hypothetical protein
MALGLALLLSSVFGVVWRVVRLLGGTGYVEPGTLKEGVKRLVKRASAEHDISVHDADVERPRLHALVRPFISLLLLLTSA